MQSFNTVELFNDPTNGGINLRYLLRMMQLRSLTDMKDEETKSFLNILLLIAKKLAAVWTHFERYRNIEKELIEKTSAAKVGQQQQIAYSQDLFLEFDEFLVQVKSTLDYLMQIPRPILGTRWGLRTFRKRGRAVIDALHNNIPDKWKEKGDWLADTLLTPHLDWLEASIQGRDMMNHCLDGGFKFESFIVCKSMKDGREYIHVPQFEDGMTIHKVMEITWVNLLSLVEDFTAGFLAFRIKPEYVIWRNKPIPFSKESPWNAMLQENFVKLKQATPAIKKL